MDNNKEKYFSKLASQILENFQSREYKDLEEFCEYLKDCGKSATVQLRGVESYTSNDKFYKNLLDN